MGNATRIRLLSVAAILCLGILVCVELRGVASSVHAQERETVIREAQPRSPFCIELDSHLATYRTLTVLGAGFPTTDAGRLQFRQPSTGNLSALFGDEPRWETPNLAVLDLRLVEDSLWHQPKMTLQVRLTDGDGEPLSSWSNAVKVVRNASDCSTPREAPFPPEPPTRGVAGDLWADVVIGKPDFTQIAPKSVVPFKLFNPGGVVVDRSTSPGRMYVWDGGNSRVLGIDLAECYAGEGPCSADVVIGQPSGYDHGGCNGDSSFQGFPIRPLARADTLCGIPEWSLSPWESHTFVTMAVDGSGALYVPDSHNNRVLKYEDPFATDSVADEVWGQWDFAGQVCNRGGPRRPTGETLCFHSHTNMFRSNFYGNGVEIDPDGNMWVADGGNNRVLRFPVDSATGTIAKAADLVLGQHGFHKEEPGEELNEMHGPSAVTMAENGWLYVADTLNDRTLVFEPPFQTGMEASREFGSGFRRPTSLEIDPTGAGIWVHDSQNYMVELWDIQGSSVLRVLGKDSYRPTEDCGVWYGELPSGLHLCPIAGGIGIDGLGNVLVSVFLDNAEVVRFPSTSAGGAQGLRPDRRLFYPPVQTNFKDLKGIHSPRGIAVWGDQLIVSDMNRLLFWNGLDSLANGQPADGVVGDELTTGEWHHCCGRIKVDDAGRLWVLGFEGKEILDVYQLPLTENSVPLHTIFTQETTLPILGQRFRIKIGPASQGIAPVGSGEFVWLSDTDNHRVLRIRDPMTNPVVDAILGQQTAFSNKCNAGRFPAADWDAFSAGEYRNLLCYPGALSIDRRGNLYISDHALEVNGNRRLLIYEADSLPTDNSSVLLGRSASKAFTQSLYGFSTLWVNAYWERESVIDERLALHGMSAGTWEPAFDSTNRMVVGYNAYAGPRFVGVYDDPLGRGKLPNGYLYDLASMAYTATFDDNDNLYVGDINRGRVLVYYNPFGNPPADPTPSPATATPPMPEYPLAIESVTPQHPYCVVRSSRHAYERTLELRTGGLPEDWRNLVLHFRRLTDVHREWLYLSSRDTVRVSGDSIIVDIGRFGSRLWNDREKLTMTVRLVSSEGVLLSNWSPSFVLADNVEVCGVALPAPAYTPTPVPTPTPSPEPTPSGGYAATIDGVRPEPPLCVLRDSQRGHETRLYLDFGSVPGNWLHLFQQRLQFRNQSTLGTAEIDLSIFPRLVEIEESGITVPMSYYGTLLWADSERVELTARLVGFDDVPTTNWSAKFALAQDEEACGVSWPTPTPRPVATAAPAAAPTVAPTPTAAPAAAPAVAPTATAVPTPFVIGTPVPKLAPALDPQPTPTPAVRETSMPTPTTSPTPRPAPAITPTAVRVAGAEPLLPDRPSPTPAVSPTPTSPAGEQGGGGCGLRAAGDYGGVELGMAVLLLAPLALAVRKRRRHPHPDVPPVRGKRP